MRSLEVKVMGRYSTCKGFSLTHQLISPTKQSKQFPEPKCQVGCSCCKVGLGVTVIVLGHYSTIPDGQAANTHTMESNAHICSVAFLIFDEGTLPRSTCCSFIFIFNFSQAVNEHHADEFRTLMVSRFCRYPREADEI